MAWRVAKSLEKLKAQIDQRFPNRSRASDGSIGDADHASSNSDHNPWYGPGIVTARDFTHDAREGIGLNCHRLAVRLQQSRDPRIKYVIWNKKIMSSTVQPWQWRPYNGSNPHQKHLHVSVVASPKADDDSLWLVTLSLGEVL